MLAVVMMTSNVGAAFEAIVMGVHRIDIARKFTTIFTIAEAVAIVILLHWGFGLFAMATAMGVSELAFIACCYLTARKIAPQIHVERAYISRTVLPELFRYAGSYQMVNMLEIVYGAVVPIALLRVFGADSAGVFAIAGRLLGSAAMLPDSLLPSILSGGSKVFASSSIEEMRRLIAKAQGDYGTDLVADIVYLGFRDSAFIRLDRYHQSFIRGGSLPCGVDCFFGSLSLLGLVLYRVSGKALLDNIRQVLRIVSVLSVGLFANHLGFAGVLSGLAGAELVGMIFMGYALSKTFEGFSVKAVARDFMKIATASAIILAAGVVASYIPLPQLANPRLLASLRLGLACLGCLVAAWPALYVTGTVTAGEKQVLLGMIFPRRFRSAPNA